MTDDMLQSLWNKGKQQEPMMDQTAINAILEKSVTSGWYGMRVNAWVFLAMLMGSEIFHILNLAAARSRPGWLVVHALLAAVTLAFFIFGLRMLRELRVLSDPAVSLVTLVRRQLRFFHTTFEWWIWMWSLTVWMVSFCIVVWVENHDGGYRIGHVTEFAAVSAGMIFGSYALMRLGSYPMVRRTVAALQDLESQANEETRSVQSLRKYWVVGTFLLVVALAVAVVWTCQVWLSTMP